MLVMLYSSVGCITLAVVYVYVKLLSSGGRIVGNS